MQTGRESPWLESTTSTSLVDGRTEVLSTGDGAAELVFLRDEQEIARRPLLLDPGGIARITR